MIMMMMMMLIKMMMITKNIVGILTNNRMDLNVSYRLHLDWITLIRITVMMMMAGVLVIIKMTIYTYTGSVLELHCPQIDAKSQVSSMNLV